MNPYQVLGVSPKATKEEIKEAYRKLAKQFHPDLNKDDGAEQRFKEVSAAYDLIKDDKVYNPAPNFQDAFRKSWWHARNQRVNDDFNVVCDLTLEEVYTGKTITMTIEGREITVTIPPGIVEGTSLCLGGEGSRRFPDIQAGNLYISVRVKRHATFLRNGFHLGMNCAMDVFDVLLGKTVQVKTISGTLIDVEVPPLTQHGTKLKVQGHGMPYGSGDDEKGDLYLIVSVIIPKTVTDDQVKLLNEVRDLGKSKIDT